MHIQAKARLTAAARPISEVIEDLHLMPNVSIPPAFHKKMKDSPDAKINEGFFFVDGTIHFRYFEMLKRNGIEVQYISKGKDGHDFSIAYKVT
ncbi:hypothetical protein [Achromobacter phage Motura]|uniref:Uncharacterized protein n=1 Tax=Achromobacter phage Motura TaxID=2591403 RepID=A0A514CT09_9CAUD|nr:hypothetical protein H1O15_gp170 [Achromobacter phage Motura]QDH83618.1 hypothetical protein [Achromobacter phage Motura]